MPRTRHYRDLVVWQKGMQLAREVYAHSEIFPKSEIFGLRMQLRRAAISVPSNVAEGHGRLTDPQLRNALGMARGSLYELQTQLELAGDMRYLNKDSVKKLSGLAVDVAKLINGLLGVLDD
jgi:four helix bundle protein